MRPAHIFVKIFMKCFKIHITCIKIRIDGLEGLRPRLEAGANVVTSLVPPQLGLAGVARSSLDIDNSKRSAASVLAVLERCGLEKGSPAEYRLWIEDRQKTLG